MTVSGIDGQPPIFPALPEDDAAALRHVTAMHRITVAGSDVALVRRLHENDHRDGEPGHLHESRGQPGDRPLPPIRQDFPEPPRRDHYRIFGREEFRSLPPPADAAEPA